MLNGNFDSNQSFLFIIAYIFSETTDLLELSIFK